MADLTVREFIDVVHRSRLVPKDRLIDELSQIKHEGGLPEEAERVADHFVEQNLLTPWQVKNLLRGKTKGFSLGDYRLLDHLGTGGMSTVFLARHRLIDRKVAIKVLPTNLVTEGTFLQRFEQEARATSRLSHPNVVRVFDIDEEGDTHFMVMEYLSGRDLKAIVKQDGPLSLARAAYYIAQAAIGLQHVHDRGLVHRDIKPANLVVNDDDVLKVLDLGLARMVSDEEQGSLTVINSENMMGTADYLAPEQAKNAHSVDSRADLYSLGCTFYYLLAGHAPFNQGSITERIWKHENEKPLDIRAIREDCPHAVADVCMRMLVKDPTQRLQPGRLIATRLYKWLRGQNVSYSIPSYARNQLDIDTPIQMPTRGGVEEVAEIDGEDESLVANRKARSKERVKAPLALWLLLGLLVLITVPLAILLILRSI